MLILFLVVIVILIIGLPITTGIFQFINHKGTVYTDKTIDVKITDPNDYEMVINLKDKQDIYNQQILNMEENIKYIQENINKDYEYIRITQAQLDDILNNMPTVNTDAIKSVYEQDIINKRKHINKLNVNISKLKNSIIDYKIKSDAITRKLEEIGLMYL